ncbi:MAG TPA: VanZ family protein [Steroidobacter sp.]
MLLALRYPRLWLCTGWVLVAGAVLTSIMPANHLPTLGGVSDKVEHMAAYGVLALWFAGIYPRSRYPVIAGGLLAMGVAIEWLQGAMHVGREADFLDVIANCVGIACGLTLALLWLGGWAQRVEAWIKRP